jgi:hypothetical protein
VPLQPARSSRFAAAKVFVLYSKTNKGVTPFTNALADCVNKNNYNAVLQLTPNDGSASPTKASASGHLLVP